MTSNASPSTVGLLDTSVVVDLGRLPTTLLPDVSAISAVTLAELLQGLHMAQTAVERVLRLERVQHIETAYPAVLPFDAAAAREYASLVALIIAAGRSPRPRKLDLMIAATAAANHLPLYTRNAKDLAGIESRLEVLNV